MNEFKTLLDACYTKVYYHSLKKVRNNHDAADITQNTFLKAFLRIKTVRNPERLEPWLFTICNNEISQFYRTRGKDTPQQAPGGEHSPTGAQLSMAGPQTAEDHEELHAAIDLLSDTQRQVVLLKYFGGYTMLEIALLLSASEATVKSRLYEARKSLKRILNNVENIEPLQKERRHALMATLKLYGIGAKTVPCLSLHAQKQLLECAKENVKFGTVVLAELANIPTGQAFMDESHGKLSYDELLQILARCDDASLYRLTGNEFKTWRSDATSPILRDIAKLYKSGGYIDSVEMIMYVPSMRETLGWYKKFLGWQCDNDDDAIERWHHAIISPIIDNEFNVGGQYFKGFHVRHRDDAGNGNYNCNSFIFVSGLEELRASIVEKGWSKLTEIESYAWGTKGFCLTDLNGFVLEFCEWECAE